MLHRARTGKQYEDLIEALFEPLDWLPLGQEQSLRAVTVEQENGATTHGNHLRPAIDFLAAVAAAAADDDVRLWFFDMDLLVICEHTDQPFEAESSAA